MKKKGFTLIELLAVIVILAIIAVIAIPAVLNVVEDSKKAAAEASARNIINAAETHYVKEIMQGIKVSKIDLTKGVLKYDGDQAEIGYVSLDENGKGSGKMYISGYCITAISKGELSSEKVSIEECVIDDTEGPITYANGTTIYYNPETNMKCSEKEASENTSDNTGCLKWYTFLDEGSDSINLILSHNSSGNIDWITKEDYIASGETEENWNNYEVSKKPLTALKQLKSDISTWSTDAKNTARLIEKKEIDEIVKGKEVEDTGYYFHTYTGSDQLGYHSVATVGQNNFAWLFDNTEECIEFGCNVEKKGIRSYWTATDGSYNQAYMVIQDGQIYMSGYSGYSTGIRPVIRVLKSIISPEKTSIVYASTRNLISSSKTYFYENDENLKRIDLEKVKLTYSGEPVKKGTIIYDKYGNGSGRVYIGGYCSTINPDGVIELNKTTIDKCNSNVNILRFDCENCPYDLIEIPKARLYDNESEIGSLPTFTRTGYKFLGWYTNDGEKIESTTKITKDLEITDKWEGNKYTFTLVYNDGKTQNTTIKVEYDSKITSLPTPTKAGYEFLGWFTSSGNKIYNGQYYYETEDKTLYANYEKEGTNGVAVYYNPVTNTKCTEAEATKNTSKTSGCMKWYKFLDEDSSTAKIKLLLDFNIANSVSWGNYSASLTKNISTWDSTVKSTARLISLEEVNRITGHIGGSDYRLTEEYTYGVAGTNKYAWLFNNTYACTSYGCDISNNLTDGYWTSTEKSSTSAYIVNRYGSLTYYSKTSGYYGIRPVIEVARTTIS